MLFISYMCFKKVYMCFKRFFLEGSNSLFYPPGYTLFVTLRKLAYFSQLTFIWPENEVD